MSGPRILRGVGAMGLALVALVMASAPAEIGPAPSARPVPPPEPPPVLPAEPLDGLTPRNRRRLARRNARKGGAS